MGYGSGKRVIRWSIASYRAAADQAHRRAGFPTVGVPAPQRNCYDREWYPKREGPCKLIRPPHKWRRVP